MRKFVSCFLSLAILAVVCFSSTSCLLPFKRTYKMFYDYDWVSESPAMELNFTGFAFDTRYGTLTWENVHYRFYLDYHRSADVYAQTFDLETYEYVSLFEATAEQNKDTLYLEINSSSLPGLVGEVITLTKTELPDSFGRSRFRSADSFFYIDFNNERGNYLQFENVTYLIFADNYLSSEYILFYEFSEDFVYSMEDRKDENLLFIVTPEFEGNTLALTVIRSNIENLLGQTFVLTKISE